MHPDIHFKIARDRHADVLRERHADYLVAKFHRGWIARAWIALGRGLARLRGWKQRALRRVLRTGDTLARDARWEPLTLIVKHGCVWATRSGDPHDHVLCSGASLVVPERTRLALQALSITEIEVIPGRLGASASATGLRASEG